jgi:hypothetical protein
MKQAIIWGVISALVILIILLLVISPDKGAIGFAVLGSGKSFEIRDRCGPIMNYISHTIQSEGVCETRCKAQCETLDLNYKKIEFRQEEVGCNYCMCYCKDSWFK